MTDPTVTVAVTSRAPGPLDSQKDAGLIRVALRELRSNPLAIIAGTMVVLIVLVAAIPTMFAGWFGHGDPRACNLAVANLGPRAGHPFGMDGQGCDVYANVIFGARASIVVGLLVTFFCVTVSLVLGCISGFYRGLPDMLISRVADVFFGFPFLLGAIVLLTAVQNRSVFVVALVLAALSWPSVTRLLRGAVRQVASADFVTAARGLGASNRWLILRHVLPNAIAPVIVISALNLGGYIVAEAALTYIGVGLQYPAISWGLQLSAAGGTFDQHPHLLIFPALFLSLTVLSFVVLGDAVRDALDPKLKA